MIATCNIVGRVDCTYFKITIWLHLLRCAGIIPSAWSTKTDGTLYITICNKTCILVKQSVQFSPGFLQNQYSALMRQNPCRCSCCASEEEDACLRSPRCTKVIAHQVEVLSASAGIPDGCGACAEGDLSCVDARTSVQHQCPRCRAWYGPVPDVWDGVRIPNLFRGVPAGSNPTDAFIYLAV